MALKKYVVTSILIAAVVAVSIYGGLAMLLASQQEKFIFPGAHQPIRAMAMPAELNDFENISLQVPSLANNPAPITIHGLLARPQQPKTTPPVLLIVFAGNAQDAGEFALDIRHKIAPLPDNIWVASFNYRGYASVGISASQGEPSQQAFYSDALAIYDALQAQLKPVRTYVLGYSIGSPVAAYLAANRPVFGTILLAPLANMADVAAARYPLFRPIIPWVLKHPFNTEADVAKLTAPLSIFYTPNDGVIPPGHAQRLAHAGSQVLAEISQISGTNHGTILQSELFAQRLRAAVVVSK